MVLFFFFFSKRIGHVNAITLFDVCLHLGNFKCFYKKIFLYISENIFLDDHRSYFKLFFLTIWSLFLSLEFFICLFILIQGLYDCKYIQRCFCKDFTLFKKYFKQHLTDVMYTSCCNVFILTVKIFCEKEKID